MTNSRHRTGPERRPQSRAFRRGRIPTFRERVMHEARAPARLNDPHVVTVHRIIDTHPHPWIVMEPVPGRSLRQRLSEGLSSPAESARIGRQVLAALIAVLQGATALTVTGELVGSPEYMAPERIRGHDDDPASDLWSLLLRDPAARPDAARSRPIRELCTSGTPKPWPGRPSPCRAKRGRASSRKPDGRTHARALPVLVGLQGSAARFRGQAAIRWARCSRRLLRPPADEESAEGHQTPRAARRKTHRFDLLPSSLRLAYCCRDDRTQEDPRHEQQTERQPGRDKVSRIQAAHTHGRSDGGPDTVGPAIR